MLKANNKVDWKFGRGLVVGNDQWRVFRLRGNAICRSEIEDMVDWRGV